MCVRCVLRMCCACVVCCVYVVCVYAMCVCAVCGCLCVSMHACVFTNALRNEILQQLLQNYTQ